MAYLIAVVLIIIAAVGFTYLNSDEAAKSPAIGQVEISEEMAEPVESSEVVPETATEEMEQEIEEETGSVVEPLPATEDLQVSDSSDSVDEESALTDGAHTTSVTYLTPKQDEYLLDVTLTTAAGVITDASIVYGQGAEKDPNAQRFEAAYKTEVVGKKIDELDLSRVGGASLTTAAFNRAVEAIVAENS